MRYDSVVAGAQQYNHISVVAGRGEEGGGGVEDLLGIHLINFISSFLNFSSQLK